MPNWTKNFVAVNFKTIADKERFVDFVKSESRDFDFLNVIPFDFNNKKYIVENPEDRTFEAISAEHSDFNWYAYCNDKWGTKWNACECEITEEDECSIEYYFETAWSAPDGIYKKLKKLFPEVEINWTVSYEDDGYDTEYNIEDVI